MKGSDDYQCGRGRRERGDLGLVEMDLERDSAFPDELHRLFRAELHGFSSSYSSASFAVALSLRSSRLAQEKEERGEERGRKRNTFLGRIHKQLNRVVDTAGLQVNREP